MGKQRTQCGEYSASSANFGKDKIRNVEISPPGGMREIKSYAAAVDANSGFAKPGADGRKAGFAGAINVGAGRVIGRVDPHGSENQRKRLEFMPERPKRGGKFHWE
jgi:hypothetical protein